MKTNILLLVIFSYLFTIITNDLMAQASYLEQINQERTEKDASFKDADSSPLKPEQIAAFEQLDYFLIDENYKVEGIYQKLKGETSFKMNTSTDRLLDYKKYALLIFEISGKSYSLNLYQNISLSKNKEYKRYLFLPFNDLTNGEETYGGGRYLDIEKPKGKKTTVWLDFNKAYNPYCAYNDKYSCPIPPIENRLDTEIRAGEKGFKK